MTEPKFKRGDVVRLKCGGPAMAIDGPYPISPTTTGHIYRVRWHLQNGEMTSCEVTEDTLDLVERDGRDRTIDTLAAGYIP